MIDAEEGIDGTFSDIADLVSQCAFSDCTHRNEPGCAVRRALEDADYIAVDYRVDYEKGTGWIHHIFDCEGV